MKGIPSVLAVLLFVTFTLAAPCVRAFSVLEERGSTAAAIASRAPRWSAEPDPFGMGTGLHDGIQVAVDPDFVAGLGVAEIAVLYGVSESLLEEMAQNAVRAAFAMWENTALRFEIEFDGPAVEGTSEGREIDLFARPVPAVFFGFAVVEYPRADARLLVNGQRLPGLVIVGADVVINTNRILEGARLLAQFGIPLELLAGALQILVAHEVGHAIGLGHPNQSTFLDTDTDPYNEMVIDFTDPFRDLIISSIPLNTPGELLPIMWGGLSSSNPTDLLALLARLENPVLTFDDRAGRDVLYPAEPLPPSPTPTEEPTATTTPTATPNTIPTATVLPCSGDCNADRNVTISELILAVTIALGEAPAGACRAADLDGDSSVRIDELLRAVQSALDGCG